MNVTLYRLDLDCHVYRFIYVSIYAVACMQLVEREILKHLEFHRTSGEREVDVVGSVESTYTSAIVSVVEYSAVSCAFSLNFMCYWSIFLLFCRFSLEYERDA